LKMADIAEIKALLDQIDQVKMDNAALEAEIAGASGPKWNGPTFKLTYFETRGRAELTRLCFAAGSIPYEEKNVGFPELEEMKKSGESPFGQLPVLNVDGKNFGESYSIAKYVSKLAGVHSSDPLEALAIEGIVDYTDGIRSAYVPIRYGSKGPSVEEKVKAYHTYFSETLPPRLANLERILAGKNFFSGDSMTVADLAVMNVIDQLSLPNCPDQLADAGAKALNDNCLPASKYPGLVAMCARVKAEPKIAAYLASRRKAIHGMGYAK